MTVKEQYLRLHSLTVFAGIRRDPVIAALEEMLIAAAEYAGDRHEDEPGIDWQEIFVESYCAFAAALYERDTDWTRFLHGLVMEDDNVCVRQTAAGKPLSGPLAESLAQELTILQDLSRLSSEEVTADLDYDGYLPRWETSDCDLAADYSRHLEELPHKGYGMFAKYHTFRVDDGGIVPILTPDPQRLSDLVRYEREREPVIANTKAFLQGLPANNVLLYGDAGTGKSSTVKAIVNEYKDQGLRLIEIKQSQFTQIPKVLEHLAGNPLHFILFIDDLSFDSGSDDFIALKNILEGGAYDTRGNVLIYATSNRRHFVKEDASARSGSDLFVNDTIQETMSLAARFGLTVTFQKPAKDLYLEIVEALADRTGIEMDREELRTQAEAFAIRASGRSPRTARQFIDTVNIRDHIQ